ncbi:hypothetical protein EGI22_17255 [Lacihabitans sp. LS3-19]|uniref:hypothetical protein n=1 Tax=Lacihabitans sp. LS3-19 TaxID=2487335 RepID=UPI0020CBC01B|nr:hypothetical protein [Lacihabitans sp. LS3-19]MCP9769653.1 hypothetical protein [Lacihabitans sp. LS3-19]
MRYNWDSILTKSAYLYLSLPFLIFCVSWLNLPSAFAFSAITLVSIFFSLKNVDSDPEINFLLIKKPKTIIWALTIILFIIFFSGIGHYTYQNNDHLYRGALFADLVKYDWPVMYHVTGFPGHFLEGKTTMMTYYLGFYLPSAAVGKLFGLSAARFALFLWTFIGTVLVVFQVGKYLKRFNLKLLLLFFGWGTLFFIGALYKNSFIDIYAEKANPLWAGMILYADSNLGLIYWTFNQSLTAWLIILLIFNKGPKKNLLFLYSLCFFLSPFAFVGLLPFVLYYFFTNLEGKLFQNFWKHFVPYISFQNILGAGLVVALNFLYLNSNKAAKFFQVLSHSPKKFIVFMLLSWVIIAFLISPRFKKNALYWLVVAVLIPLPFFQQGYGIDFPGRLSIPALFLLMLKVGQFLIEEKKSFRKYAVLAYMAISATWHIGFELGKSIIWTSAENISHKTSIDDQLMDSDNPKLQELGKILKDIEGKNILIQDHKTIVNPKNDVIWNYMADIEGSTFYRWFAKKR